MRVSSKIRFETRLRASKMKMAIPKTSLGYRGDPSRPGQRKLPKAQPLRSQWSSTRACCRYPRRVGFAINTTSNGCPNVPASYAGGNRQILIIFGSRSRERSGARSATSLYVPLCRAHHREVHRSGDEVVWWTQAGIDPLRFAQKFWRDTHPLQQSVAEKSDAL